MEFDTRVFGRFNLAALCAAISPIVCLFVWLPEGRDSSDHGCGFVSAGDG